MTFCSWFLKIQNTSKCGTEIFIGSSIGSQALEEIKLKKMENQVKHK